MQRVVILGGGYAGIEACKKIVKMLPGELSRKEVELTLVSRDPYHTFHGWTTEVLGGLIPLQHTLTPLKEILPDSRIRQLIGSVQHVDLTNQQVTVQTPNGPEILRYDHVFFGLGSRDPFERIEGLEQHGWCLKDTLHMQKFRAELHERIADHLQGGPCLGRIAVIGGGFAGVECAAALAELLRDRYQGRPELKRPTITLLHSGKVLLEALQPDFQHLADWATRELQNLEVKVKYGCRIQHIQPEGVNLHTGDLLKADMVLVTAGISMLALPGTETLERNPQRKLRTTPFLQAEGHKNVWTGGDIADVKHPFRDASCPVNALWAMKQGLHAGSNIARAIKGRPLKPFRYPGLGQAASLGWGRGITELYGLQFTGFLGWLLRLGFFLWYMPSKKGGLRVLKDILAVQKRGRRLDPDFHLARASTPTLQSAGS
ncbi:NAD(P)/FAD-dependent oxidoreductase [Deinococcus cellulosilyticus]|uniref:NADH dehydrogenase n=1 Tax=Deinococcus cellulosilyticus (strain DSM 18568 / NBRC 106333 / KACC 11606 / 5516J-15) TaxID=1223518 RepID=A0A511N363_DEIC1|nr:FAD-dependent oxidoreductase [Deinococcus cellulosilyticus]GEM46856.1 NADH dehydrogenase [Deinococcus cellulosilyticus NBRC 106333 = KACC 11606]